MPTRRTTQSLLYGESGRLRRMSFYTIQDENVCIGMCASPAALGLGAMVPYELAQRPRNGAR
jgi:hypothetical protein